MRVLVIARFHGKLAFSIAEHNSPPRQKDERWREIDRLPIPAGVGLDEAIALFNANKLKSAASLSTGKS